VEVVAAAVRTEDAGTVVERDGVTVRVVVGSSGAGAAAFSRRSAVIAPGSIPSVAVARLTMLLAVLPINAQFPGIVALLHTEAVQVSSYASHSLIQADRSFTLFTFKTSPSIVALQ